MTARISLALVLHNHQPVGNFGWVFADVYEKAYEPMLAAIERHPRIRLGLHYTGALLEWLQAERPEFIARLRALVEREQVEVLGGGLFEPVLPSLPQRDRIGQLERMATVVAEAFGRRPSGAWLAERVWEPDLPTSLAAAGYGYTILDDTHFRAAAVPEDAMWGPYTTDDQGHPLSVFGTEQGLRYLIPFRPVDEVIAYLHDHATEAGERVGMMGDDGEKFGAWPSTWEHCWGKGRWVESFFEALEANAEWLPTVRPRDWLATHPPVGRVYVPTSSYAEMGEWVLPPAESRAFAAALHHARDAHLPEARWLRGGFWRNFQVKYREINDLHKQMLRVSAAVDAMTPGRARGEAIDHLYRGQSNDCYWHGLFGGIYIAHMRSATFEHLIAAEDLADTALGRLEAAERRDLDLDGRDEVRLATAGQVVTVELDEGSGIGSWDLRAGRHAVGAVLGRRPEAYHETVRASDGDVAESGDVGGDGDGDGTVPASIHDVVKLKEAGLAARLVYDGYERRSGLVRALPLDATEVDWRAGGGPDLGDPAAPTRLLELADGYVVTEAMTAIAGQAVRIRRRIGLSGGRLDPVLTLDITIEHLGDAAIEARLGIEWVTTMLGGGGNPAAWWDVGGTREGHDTSGARADLTELTQGNDWLGVAITTTVSPGVDAWWAPIETVSNSEDGFERAYQGSALLLSAPLALARGETWSMQVEHEARVARDRALPAAIPAAAERP
jgi:4-alpha-glucanotransferase